ncbi:MAG: SRPBCC domain-containing protein [Polyangiaceae bacterium]|nr:SRPBCC domain-containing protein [Polyangiaceae bacterium]
MPTFHLLQPVRAPRSVVWHACSDALGLAAWQADEVSGDVERGARLTFRWPSLGAEIEVKVIDIEHGERVVFGWGDRRVTLTLSDGGVALAHSALPYGDEYAGTGSSWALSLANLAHYCEHHARRPRVVHWLISRARTDNETAHVFFSDDSALGAWLGKGNGIGPAGSDYRLELSPDHTLSGRVLAHTPDRDVLLSWSEDDDSTLSLRTLPSPLSDDEITVALTWSRWSDKPALPGAWIALSAAHQRLVTLLDGSADA